MRLIFYALRHFLPLGLIATMGAVLFSAAAPVTSTRVDGFGVEMSALPALTLENVEALVTLIDNSGAKYIRQEINWSEIENSPDVYNWSAVTPLDLLFTSAQTHDIKVVAVLNGGPVYLATPGQLVDRTALGDRWEKFVQAAVNYFGESVDVWEIGSGINGYRGMSPFLTPLSPRDELNPDPQFYTKLLRSASKIIKDTDPNDQVWMGSLVGFAANDCAMSPLTFLLEFNAAKGWKAIDAIPYQPRQGAAAPEFQAAGAGSSACSSNLMTTSTSVTTEIEAVQELARQLGGKQVIITGLGWSDKEINVISNGRGISTGQLESDLLVRASTALMAQNSIATIFWQTDISSNLSSYNALVNLQQALGDTKPLGQVQGQAGSVYEYRFRQGGVTTSITWRITDGDTPYPVNLDAVDIKSFMAYPSDSAGINKETGISIPSNDAGQVMVMLNERPVIFIGRSGDLTGNLKLAITDQVELWKLEIDHLVVRLLNNQKAAFKDILEEMFNKAKESAVEWGEGKLEELLP